MEQHEEERTVSYGIQTKKYKSYDIRIAVGDDDTILFCAKDSFIAMGYSENTNARNIIRSAGIDDKAVHIMCPTGWRACLVNFLSVEAFRIVYDQSVNRKDSGFLEWANDIVQEFTKQETEEPQDEAVKEETDLVLELDESTEEPVQEEPPKKKKNPFAREPENNQNFEIFPAINFEQEHPIDARELHKRLEIGRDFSTWIKQMIGYGFVENTDYTVVKTVTEQVFPELGENLGGRPRIDYLMSFDMAKHICMIQRSAVGMKIRQYFIDVEKAWRQNMSPLAILEQNIKRLRELEEQTLKHDKNLRYINKVMGINDMFNTQDHLQFSKKIDDLDSRVNSIQADLSQGSPREFIKRAVKQVVSLKEDTDSPTTYGAEYTILYDEIAERSGTNLDSRLKLKRERAIMEGMSRTRASQISILDVIDEDKRLWIVAREVTQDYLKYYEEM